jgi:TetR/AcrR family transcriptional repressor of nem operon
MPRPSVRGQLIKAGVERLHAQGFNGCSIQDITEAAGVPKGSFFNHFKSKELLAIEVLGPYGESSKIEMLFDESKTPLHRLRDHFSYLADSYEHWNFERGCLLGNFATEMATSHPQMRETLKSIFRQWSEAVSAVIRDAQAAGEVDPRLDADKLGHFLVNAWEGIAMRLKVEKSRAPVNDFLDITFRQLLT